MNKPLKIAIYSGEIPSTTFIERLITGLSSKGQRVWLFGIKRKSVRYPQSVSVIGYKTNRLSKTLHFLKYSFLLSVFKNKQKHILDSLLESQNRNTLNDKLKSYPVLYHQPDVFHVQWAKGLDDWMWVRDFGMKLVLSLRGAHINYSPIADLELADMYRKNFPKVDAFHAVSEAIAEEASKYGAALDRITVVKSGLTAKEFSFELKNHIPRGTMQIVSVGRNHWIKNYQLALDVMSCLKNNDFPFHYSIIGIEDNEALLYQRHQLKLEDEVSFINTLPFHEVQAAIKNADILLLPSLKEGIANVVLEAMMLGTIVISTDCGGMPEVVIPNKTGVLVSNRDVDALVDAIASVSTMALDTYQNMLLDARAFVEHYHSSDGMLSEMLNLYQNITRKEL